MNKTNATKKPFPWKCINCKEKMVYEEVVTHEVDVEHDGRTYHVKIDGLKTPKCKKCGFVQPDSEANEAISLAFLVQAKLLLPKQIREYREGLCLTQKLLATAIGVAEATVSRWETGSQIQQRSLDNLLRLFFGLPVVQETLLEQKIGALGFVKRVTTSTGHDFVVIGNLTGVSVVFGQSRDIMRKPYPIWKETTVDLTARSTSLSRSLPVK